MRLGKRRAAEGSRSEGRQADAAGVRLGKRRAAGVRLGKRRAAAAELQLLISALSKAVGTEQRVTGQRQAPADQRI